VLSGFECCLLLVLLLAHHDFGTGQWTGRDTWAFLFIYLVHGEIALAWWLIVEKFPSWIIRKFKWQVRFKMTATNCWFCARLWLIKPKYDKDQTQHSDATGFDVNTSGEGSTEDDNNRVTTTTNDDRDPRWFWQKMEDLHKFQNPKWRTPQSEPRN
jgi:hypothetical protein